MRPDLLRKRLREHPEYRYFLFIPAYLLCFFLVERLVPADADYWVSYAPLDDRIPFVEAFVIPYCLWYPFLLCCGLALLVSDPGGLRRYMRFLMLGFGFCLLFCLVFPNGQNLRPDPMPRDNLFTRLLALIYAADTNTNVLPSMHVVGCIAGSCAIFHTRGRFRSWRWASLVLAVLISLSTVFVKQHSILDVLAGIAVSIPLVMVLYRPVSKKAGIAKEDKIKKRLKDMISAHRA